MCMLSAKSSLHLGLQVGYFIVSYHFSIRCAPYCRVLFPGCRCEQGGCKTNKCTCYLAGWECNPDTCSTCNCDIYDATATSKPICSNIAIQHGWKKDIRIGVSTLPNAGYGVFIQQMADKVAYTNLITL